MVTIQTTKRGECCSARASTIRTEKIWREEEEEEEGAGIREKTRIIIIKTRSMAIFTRTKKKTMMSSSLMKS